MRQGEQDSGGHPEQAGRQGHRPVRSAGGDHPCTGELVQVDGGLLEDFLSKGYTPVVATIAQGAEDPTQVYSVSANHTAAKLAVALKAEKLIHLVAAEQLLHTPESPDAPIPVLPLSQVPALIRNGTIPADMAGKVNFSVEAVRSGVKSATLLDGSVPHAILLELLSDEGISQDPGHGGPAEIQPEARHPPRQAQGQDPGHDL